MREEHKQGIRQDMSELTVIPPPPPPPSSDIDGEQSVGRQLNGGGSRITPTMTTEVTSAGGKNKFTGSDVPLGSHIMSETTNMAAVTATVTSSSAPHGVASSSSERSAEGQGAAAVANEKLPLLVAVNNPGETWKNNLHMETITATTEGVAAKESITSVSQSGLTDSRHVKAEAAVAINSWDQVLSTMPAGVALDIMTVIAEGVDSTGTTAAATKATEWSRTIATESSPTMEPSTTSSFWWSTVVSPLLAMQIGESDNGTDSFTNSSTLRKSGGGVGPNSEAIVVNEDGSVWPVKHAAIVEGDVVIGGLMMVHEREDSVVCGPIMPQGGVQALEAMLYTLDKINGAGLLPNITLGAHILDDCDKDTYGLEMAVDFIKGK